MCAVRKIVLSWSGDGLVFRGSGASGVPVTIDGNAGIGPTPMETLLLSLASCTASDVVEILGKMRVPLSGLEVLVEGERADEPPRRYTRILARYIVEGVPEAAEHKLQRAVELSVERYCSVLQSFRPDIEFKPEVVRR